MDTSAVLTKQGWQGDGHGLHHSGRGIIKPIRVTPKSNVLGVGRKKHDAHADQWWARAFDDTLKDLTTTKDESTGDVAAVSMGAGAQALQLAGKGGPRWAAQRGLYSNFVRGESLEGTFVAKGKVSARLHGGSDEEIAVEELMSVKPLQCKVKKTSQKGTHRIKVVENPGAVTAEAPEVSFKIAEMVGGYSHKSDICIEAEPKKERQRKRKGKRDRKVMRKAKSAQRVDLNTTTDSVKGQIEALERGKKKERSRGVKVMAEGEVGGLSK